MSAKPGIKLQLDKNRVITGWDFGHNADGVEYLGKLPRDFFMRSSAGKYRLSRSGDSVEDVTATPKAKAKAKAAAKPKAKAKPKARPKAKPKTESKTRKRTSGK